MVSKIRFHTVAASLAVGTLAIAGFGLASPAFADENPKGASTTVQTPAAPSVPAETPQTPVTAPVAPTATTNNPPNNPTNQAAPGVRLAQQALPQIQRQLVYVPAAVRATYSGSDIIGTSGFVSATAEVLNLPSQTIVTELDTGMSLTQIAAQHGWSRDAFLAALTNRIELNIVNGETAGSYSASTANNLLSNLSWRVSSTIDQAGLQNLLQGVSATAWFSTY